METTSFEIPIENSSAKQSCHIVVSNIRPERSKHLRFYFDAELPDHSIYTGYKFALSDLGKPYIYNKSEAYGLWVPSGSRLEHYTPEARHVLEKLLILKLQWMPEVWPHLNKLHKSTCQHHVNRTLFCAACWHLFNDLWLVEERKFQSSGSDGQGGAAC